MAISAMHRSCQIGKPLFFSPMRRSAASKASGLQHALRIGGAFCARQSSGPFDTAKARPACARAPQGGAIGSGVTTPNGLPFAPSPSATKWGTTILCDNAACVGPAAAARSGRPEQHRAPTLGTLQLRAFRGTDAREFPILRRAPLD